MLLAEFTGRAVDPAVAGVQKCNLLNKAARRRLCAIDALHVSTKRTHYTVHRRCLLAIGSRSHTKECHPAGPAVRLKSGPSVAIPATISENLGTRCGNAGNDAQLALKPASDARGLSGTARLTAQHCFDLPLLAVIFPNTLTNTLRC